MSSGLLPYLFDAITPQLRSFILSHPKPDQTAISNDTIIYELLFPARIFGTSSLYADVEDIAKLHVRAINASAQNTKDLGGKRLITVSPELMDWNTAVQAIR